MRELSEHQSEIPDLTEGEKLSLDYENYPLRHTLVRADQIVREEIDSVGPDRNFSLVEATLYGLNEALVRGNGFKLRKELDKEIALYEDLVDAEGDDRKYGYYAQYSSSGDTVHYANPAFHRLALVTSNSRLYEDPNFSKEWEDVRDIFENLVVAVAGASVGNNIAHIIAQDIRPLKLKIADPNVYKLSNANRVRLTYRDVVYSNNSREELAQRGIITAFGTKNKAISTAEQIHGIDPFMQIWAYYEGINNTNLDSFLVGNRVEPAADFVVEETDNPNVKVMIRERARQLGKRVIMATDAGSAIQVDVRPFDVDPSATLAYGIADEDVYERQRVANDDRTVDKKEAFFRFADGLLGNEYRRGEFGKIITDELLKPFVSVPQLGSTAATAGGFVTEVIARTALGHNFPERFIVDKRTLEVQEFGERV